MSVLTSVAAPGTLDVLRRALGDDLPDTLDVDGARLALLSAVGGDHDAPSWQPSRSGYAFGIREGRAFVLEASAGTVAVRAIDEARAERRRDNVADVDVHAVHHRLTDDPDDPRTGPARLRVTEDWQRFAEVEHTPGYRPVRLRRITEWSARSRSRMVRAIGEYDYAPMAAEGGVSAMVTLTYPGDWEAVAPTREAVNGHVGKLRRRWGRAFLDGAMPRGLWKVEFQRRGAPHLHAFMRVHALAPDADCRVPEHRDHKGRLRVNVCRCTTFERWLSRTWADVVAADKESGEYGRHLVAGSGIDFGQRTTDPRRLAVYFLKHGTKGSDGKEYQHRPPRAWLCDEDGVIGDDHGTGRYWGAWGLKRARVAVYVDARTYYAVRRQIRRMMRAEGRKLHRGQLGVGGGNGGGWMLANDGLGAALDAADRARSLLGLATT